LKIVLSCGHPHAAYQIAHQALVAGGLATALPSRREALTAEDLHEKIFRAHDLDQLGLSAAAKLNPGRVWVEMATDLIAGNLDSSHWGWADARAVWLLDFWKEIEPQIRFVLVYTAPEFALGQMLNAQEITPQSSSQAIASWVAYNTELLRFYHRNQDTCLLVNAAEVINAPEALLKKAANHFGLEIALAGNQANIDSTAISAVATALAKTLIEDNDEVRALYRELESAADINAQDNGTQKAEYDQALTEYTALLNRLHTLSNEAVQKSSAVENLKFEHSQIQQLLEATKQQLVQQVSLHSEHHEKHTATINGLNKDNELLLLQLHNVQEELERSALGAERLVQENAKLQATIKAGTQQQSESSKLADVRQSEIQQLTKGNAEKTRQISDLQTKTTQLTQANNTLTKRLAEQQNKPNQSDELKQENELLLLQLHQVQEELENYFLKYQELAGKGANKQTLNPFSNATQPAAVTFDLRGEIEGDNWYHPEADGRWAGPNDTSTLTVQTQGAGQFELELEAADAMEPEILADMQVSLNGTPLEISNDWDSYPAVIAARFAVDEAAAQDDWVFQFKFSKLVSPSQHGSEDTRNLAIRLSTLTVKKTNG
jgi:hypothetical protein